MLLSHSIEHKNISLDITVDYEPNDKLDIVEVFLLNERIKINLTDFLDNMDISIVNAILGSIDWWELYRQRLNDKKEYYEQD